MNEIALLKLAHVIGFAYWLGADLGVFYSSYFVANDKLSPDVRINTAKILFALDQAPRICMTLMLPIGLHLGWRYGFLNFSNLTMTLIWLLSLAWLTMVVVLHLSADSAGKRILTRVDFWFRVAVAGGLLTAGGYSLVADTTALPYWFAWKVVIFGALVGCGLAVRIRLKNFGPAFAELLGGQPSAAANRTIAASFSGTRPFVVAIWIGLLLSAALGLHVF